MRSALENSVVTLFALIHKNGRSSIDIKNDYKHKILFKILAFSWTN